MNQRVGVPIYKTRRCPRVNNSSIINVPYGFLSLVTGTSPEIRSSHQPTTTSNIDNNTKSSRCFFFYPSTKQQPSFWL